MLVTINKWGNNLAVRLPAHIVKLLNLKKGQEVELNINEDGGVSMRPIDPKITLDQILTSIPEGYKPEKDLFETDLPSEQW